MKRAHDYFTTYDLNLSATLLSLGFTLEKIEKKESKGLFYFKKRDDLLKKIDDYFKDQILISPQSFANSLKAIKNRLYSNLEERG